MTALAGVGPLVRLALRRDRVLLPLWIAVFAGTAGVSAAATVDLYPDIPSRVQAARTLNSTPALVALYGRIYDETALGAVALVKLSTFGALLAVLGIVLVVRHTRAEEEAGRLELVGSGAVGRYAPLTAALLVAGGTVVTISGCTAAALVLAGLPGAGAVAFGLAWAGAGLAFVGVAAVTAQLTPSARAATGLAAGVVGAAFLLRAVGDSATATGPRWLAWASPLGWAEQVRPFAGNRLILAAPLALLAVLSATAGYLLLSRRDLGAGLLPDRPGPDHAAPRLRSGLALGWRLQRAGLLAWTAVFAVLGLVVGTIASGVAGLLDNDQAREYILRLGGRSGLTDAFLAAELGIIAVFASAYGVQAALRPHGEEVAGRLEPLLATRLSRARWLAGHVVLAVTGATALMLAAGLCAGAAHAGSTGDVGQVGRVLGGALAQLPAVWVVTAIPVAVFGLAPRLSAAGWVALLAFLLLGELGALLRLPQAALDLSPYTHVPRLPGNPVLAGPLAVLTAVAAALTAAGLVGFRRRDVQ